MSAAANPKNPAVIRDDELPDLHEIARAIIKEHGLVHEKDYDKLELVDTDNSPAKLAVKNLNGPQLGELICDDQGIMDIVEWHADNPPKEGSNNYEFLRNWAAYMVSLAVYEKLDQG